MVRVGLRLRIRTGWGHMKISRNSRSEDKDATVVVAPREPTASADALIRLLLAHAKDSGASAQPLPEGDVLFSAEVDGVTCRLTRPSSRPEPAGGVALSPREREIARLVAKGYPDKVIATLLEISKYTVGTHLRRMYQKLAVPSRAALIAKIMSNGLF